MKKIAFISESCYVHIDFDLLPNFEKSCEIGWFPYFSYESDEIEILKRKECIPYSYFEYLKLTKRMRSFFTFKKFFQFLRKIKKWNPDLIYVNGDGFPFLPLIVNILFDRKKIIAAIHDVKAHTGSSKITTVYKQILPKLYKNLNTYSDYSFNELKALYPNKNITLAHHPFTSYGEIHKKKTEKFTLLFFGSFVEYKGLDFLIEVGKALYKENQNFCIKICGHGDEKSYISDIKNHPAFILDNRYIPDSEITNIFETVDCLVLPYTDATQSGPMMIALNYEIPVIASNISAFRFWGEKFSLVTLVERNIVDWKYLIMQMIKNKNENKIQYISDEIRDFKKQIQKEWSFVLGIE